MLKDITLGQYFPMDSIVHKMDARYKIIITMIFLVMLFWGQHPTALIAGFLFVTAATALSKIPPKMVIKSLKPIIPILIITGLLNLFMLDGGDTLFQWKFLKITEQGVQTSVFMLLRICLLIAGTSLLTYTTSPIVLTDAIESLLSPLKKLNLPVHELAMMMTIALRFVPTLIEETDTIMKAQQSRGADFSTGNVLKRVRHLIPILVPLFISSFRRADELATAMEARCYRGGEGRTRMKELHVGGVDYAAAGATALLLAAMGAMKAAGI